MSRKLLKTQAKMSREEASQKLHDLADKIGEGEVSLKAGNDSVNLRPSENVEFELDVEEEKDGDISIEIEVEWPEKPETGDFQIS